MTKKLALILVFFITTPLVLALSFYFLGFSENEGKVLGGSTSPLFNSEKIFAALPTSNGVMAPTIIGNDATSIVIENYLKYYQSPLLPYKDKIIALSAQYGIKPQLILAIAQQESNLGKKSPEGCFNAWGWGIHSKGTKCYSSWEEAIESIIKGIARDYCSKGYCEDACEMMKKYTPRSDGSWCLGVNQFLAELENGDF